LNTLTELTIDKTPCGEGKNRGFVFCQFCQAADLGCAEQQAINELFERTDHLTIDDRQLL